MVIYFAQNGQRVSVFNGCGEMRELENVQSSFEKKNTTKKIDEKI